MDEPELRAENERLQRRVEALEAEVQMLRRETAVTVAAAQDKLYWFDRWGVDLNRVMAHREAELARKGFRGVRLIYRSLLRQKRRLV